jgi:hypothetical protein
MNSFEDLYMNGMITLTELMLTDQLRPHFLITPGVTDCGEFRLRVVPDDLRAL